MCRCVQVHAQVAEVHTRAYAKAQPSNQPTHQPTNQSTDQLTNQPTHQPTNQSTKRLTNQPTKVIDDELNPEWDDEKVIVGVNPDETPGESTDMVIAVWDSDGPLLKGDFLGQIKIPRETLLFPAEPGQV